jgi:coproporphyrinogen III oxidase
MTPGTIIEEDVAYVKAEMENFFNKRVVDITPYRAPLLKGHHKDWLKAACIGASFYSRPLEVNEKNFNLVKDSFETFLDAYLKILKKRKDQEFSDKDIEAQFDMRRRLLEKDFLWDPYTSKQLVPYKVWSFQMSPPEVRF